MGKIKNTDNMTEIKGEPIYTSLPIISDENTVPTSGVQTAVATLAPSSSNTVDSKINYVSEKYNAESIDKDDSDDYQNKNSQRVAAGWFGGVVGCIIGGPILALIAGFGTAHLTKRKDIWGETSRAAGDIALFAKEKYDEISEKHSKSKD